MVKELPQGVGAGAVPAARSAGRSGADRALRWASRRARILAPLLTLMAMIAFFSVASDRFLDVANFQNILTQVGRVAVAATGITFVLLCAEIDLSIARVIMNEGIPTRETKMPLIRPIRAPTRRPTRTPQLPSSSQVPTQK